jgi:2-methylcitrate dehydratase PrpD
VVWKEYASCAWTHPALDALKELLEDSEIDPGKVQSIEIVTHKKACQLGTELPRTTEEAQFNLAWPIAAFLVDGEVGPAQIKEERLEDPEIRKVASQVNAEESREMTRLYDRAVRGEDGGKHVAEVKLVTETGREISSGQVEGNIRYPPRGWDQERIEGKFTRLAADVTGEKKAGRLLEKSKEFIEIDDVGKFCSDCSNLVNF